MQQIILIKYQVHKEEKKFHLLKKIQGKWENIGTLLGVSLNNINNYETNEQKCKYVLNEWLENGSSEYPVEWDGLIKLLQDVSMKVVAEELREALEHKF